MGTPNDSEHYTSMPGNPEDDKNYNQQEVGMMSSKPVAFEYMKQLE